MADPHPARGPHASTQSAGQPVRAEVHRTEGTQYQPIIRYYKQMRTQHTYRLNVTLPRVPDARPPAATATGAVRIRPVIAGAVVQPPEAEVLPGKADSLAAFQITPAAVGRLRDARVQLYHRDRLVTEVPLKMKGTRQTWTWILLCLTIAVPLLVVPVFGQRDWLRSTGDVRYHRAHPTANIRQGSNAVAGQVGARQGPAGRGALGASARPTRTGDDFWDAYLSDLQPAAGRGPAAGGARMARNGDGRGLRGPGRGGPGRGGPGRGGPGRGGAARGARMSPPPIAGPNGASEEPNAAANEADASADHAKVAREREFRGTIEHAVFHVLPSWIPQKVSVPVATGLQDGYDWVATYAINWAELPFYLAIILLVLTIGSWATHARYPGRRRAKAITLA